MTYRTRTAFEAGLLFAAITAIVALTILGRPADCALADAGCAVGDNESFDQNIVWASGTAFEVELEHAATAGRTITFPDATDTLVMLDETQTLTAKTLTAPDFNNGTIDGSVIGGGDPVTLQGLDLDDLVTGNILYASGADTLARLVTGANTEVLTLAAGIPSWAASAITALNNATENEMVTVGNTTTELDSEANLLYDGNIMFLGDNANGSMTVGQTINQGGNDNHIITFKSTDVGHGMTVVEETDTFASFAKTVGADGGLQVIGLTEGVRPIWIIGRATTEDTTDTVNSLGAIQMTATLKSGASVGSLQAAANIFVIDNNNATRFIIKGNGDGHITNTTLVALDAMPDALMARVGRAELAPAGSFLHDNFAGIVEGAREFLSDNEIMWDNPDDEAPWMSLQNSIMLGWDMAFQNASWARDIVDVLTEDQRARLPTETLEMLGLMPAISPDK